MLCAVVACVQECYCCVCWCWSTSLYRCHTDKHGRLFTVPALEDI